MSKGARNQPSFLTSLLQSMTDHFKPHKGEALHRIRANIFGLLLIALFSNLLPLPSIQSALRLVLSSNRSERWLSDSWFRWFCIAEVTFSTICCYNILEGVWAVNYPRRRSSSLTAKPKMVFQTPPTQKRPFKVLSPNTSPQPQKPFTASHSAGYSGSPSKYPISPLSSPSRIIHYPSVTPSKTHVSSTSSMIFPTPSPIMSAYRSKYPYSVGHALDDSIIGFIPPRDTGDEED